MKSFGNLILILMELKVKISNIKIFIDEHWQ